MKVFLILLCANYLAAVNWEERNRAGKLGLRDALVYDTIFWFRNFAQYRVKRDN
jgi:hypothetical protein